MKSLHYFILFYYLKKQLTFIYIYFLTILYIFFFKDHDETCEKKIISCENNPCQESMPRDQV